MLRGITIYVAMSSNANNGELKVVKYNTLDGNEQASINFPNSSRSFIFDLDATSNGVYVTYRPNFTTSHGGTEILAKLDLNLTSVEWAVNNQPDYNNYMQVKGLPNGNVVVVTEDTYGPMVGIQRIISPSKPTTHLET